MMPSEYDPAHGQTGARSGVPILLDATYGAGGANVHGSTQRLDAASVTGRGNRNDGQPPQRGDLEQLFGG